MRAKLMSANRRGFLCTLGTVVAAAVQPGLGSIALAARRAFALRLGYASITWGGKDEQAIDDISSLGFHGIQLRSNAVEKWGERPAELRERLERSGLALLCFSSGTVDADPNKQADYVLTHVKHARFVKALGGRTLQLISRRPADRAPTLEEYRRLGKLL